MLEGTRQELESNPLFKSPSTNLEKCYSLLETLKAETAPLATKAVAKEEPKKEADATMDDQSGAGAQTTNNDGQPVDIEMK